MLSLLLLLGTLQPVTAQQIPLQAVQREPTVGANTKDDLRFNFSSPYPHIFSSVHGLLQQWPNTFFPNGHSIVPCQIPAYTNLYHGRQDGELPESPEWFAFDIEMSYGIMGSARNSHILTYQTTRPTGCLYFDGESATLFGTGQMDAQMLFIYRNVTGPDGDGRRFRGLEDEYNRASGLCQWAQDKKLGGPGWGVEGIVRMNAGFEMIWCNFTSSSARLVTRVNVTAPLLRAIEDDHDDTIVDVTDQGLGGTPTYYPLPTETSSPGRSRDPDQPPMPPGWRRDELEPFLGSQTWGWFESATWHYGSSGMGTGRGESRVRPLSCGFMTFYDPAFGQQQLARGDVERDELNLTSDGLWRGPGDDDRKAALEQLMRRRRYHLLRNISDADAAAMNSAAERVLRSLGFDNPAGFRELSTSPNCTGIDWIAVSNDIVQRYAPRLQQLKTILDASSNVDMGNSTAVRKWFSGLRQHAHFLLMPYFEYPSAPINELASSRQLTLSRCKYQYTRLIAPDYHADTLTPEEALLTSAVEETLGNICAWVVDAGLAIEREWFDHFDGKSSVLGASTFIELVDMWKTGLEELMAWLGWVDQWTYCKKGCAWDEVCYIPMWPMESVDGGGQGPGFRGPGRGYRPYGRPYGGYFNEVEGPRRPSGPPSWVTNEDSLWEPKCIKSEYTI